MKSADQAETRAMQKEIPVASGINLHYDLSEIPVTLIGSVYFCAKCLEQNRDIFICIAYLFILTALQLYMSKMDVYILYETPLYNL